MQQSSNTGQREYKSELHSQKKKEKAIKFSGMLATTVIFLKQDPSVANVNNVMY
jgi:hypothetical protein